MNSALKLKSAPTRKSDGLRNEELRRAAGREPSVENESNEAEGCRWDIRDDARRGGFFEDVRDDTEG